MDRLARLDPVTATMWGIADHDGDMTDYSPAGIQARGDHDRAALVALRRILPSGESERVAAEVMAERLSIALEQYDAGERLRDLNPVFSPLQLIRRCFDLMPTETAEHWQAVATRLAAVPEALRGAQESLRAGAATGTVAARRQVLACAEQARVWGGLTNGALPFFAELVARYDVRDNVDHSLRRALEAAASAATEAYAEASRFLCEVYAPAAGDDDPVGPERYAQWARAFNGADVDLVDTYRWGWDELHRIEAEMARVARTIMPGEPIGAVMDMLDADPERSIQGVGEFRRWLQELMDATIAALDGVHFHIPERIRRIEAMIAPDGGAAAMYYTPPSEDFVRPGRTWYPTLGRTRFPLWGEVSIAYHEGVPGHHLQLAHVRHLGGRLNRFQRTLAFVSGHAEGWALYAERLMGELGYLEPPEYELGMLRAEALRACRVVVDIGMHLQLRIPASERFSAGATWSPELARAFLVEHTHFTEEFLSSEIDRYLGMPGQAISYKVGERVWLAARDEARRRLGPAFDLRAFHCAALDLGPMGLDQLAREIAGWSTRGEATDAVSATDST
ncbi:MAG: DUF885 domain-containing protein [Acidimicrobiales bacterium]